MWSVFSKPVDIYLGQSVALVQWGSAASMAVAHAPSKPMGQVLTDLSSEVTNYLANLKVKPTKCRLWLSAALCPAIHVRLPKGLKGWRERQEIYGAGAAAITGQLQQDTVWVTAVGSESIGAAISQSLHSGLMAWAASQGWRVVSLAPVWSLGSQCDAATAFSITGIVVREPDSTTIVVANAEKLNAAITVVGNDPETTNVQVRRWLVGCDVSESELLRLVFLERPASTMTSGPAKWAKHWAGA